MHTDKGNKPSKTKAIYFPSRTKIQAWIKDYEKSMIQNSILPLKDKDIEKERNFLLKKLNIISGRYYIKAKETQNSYLLLLILSTSGHRSLMI